MLKYYVIGVSLTFLILFLHAAEAKRKPSKIKRPRKNNNVNNEFDVFALAQAWPQTSCWDLNYKKSELNRDYTCDPCKHPLKNNNWTLHGLWPDKLNGQHPFYCSRAPLDLNLFSEDLKADIRKYWRSYKLRMSDRAFWKHEWSKHGTCALQVEQTNSQEKYFAKALELLHRYNIGDILEESGVVPGCDYSFDTIYAAITEALNVSVFIKCARLPETEKQYIEEILTCFDKNFNLANCPVPKITNCNETEDVIYPNIMKSC